MAMWLCGYVAMWLCDYVTMWLCGYVAMWLCGYVAMWLCGYVIMCSYVAMYLCIYILYGVCICVGVGVCVCMHARALCLLCSVCRLPICLYAYMLDAVCCILHAYVPSMYHISIRNNENAIIFHCISMIKNYKCNK